MLDRIKKLLPGQKEGTAPPPEPTEEEKVGFFDTPIWLRKLSQGLSRTRENLVGQMRGLFRMHQKIDDDFWDDLEAVLLQADVGAVATDRIIQDLKKLTKERAYREPEVLLGALKEDLAALLQHAEGKLLLQPSGPTVVMVVGVNGTGKTTTIAKLAHHLQNQGKKVLLAAGDTFRAAAIDQLQIWADRLQVDLIKQKEGSDPAAVAYDAVNAAKARGADVLIVDTAGRLHSKVNLMEELKKTWRVLGRDLPGAPHECLLVLDATMGQNALIQARTFGQDVGVSGLVLTKMDGTAKGGIIIAIAHELNVPVKYIGVGEALDDLREFDAQSFVEALFSTDAEVSPDA